jgi:hypothetical protein
MPTKTTKITSSAKKTKTLEDPKSATVLPKSKKTTRTKTVKSKPVATKKVVTSNSKVSALEEKLKITEEKLDTLINIIHKEMKDHLIHGPEGLATSLEKKGLIG